MSVDILPSRRSRWIPWVFVGGMLLVVAVNSVLVSAAVSTFTGTTAGHAYDRGRTYNHVLEEAARQRALGWSAELSWKGDQLLLHVRDREGLSLTLDTDVAGLLHRPLQGREVPLGFHPIGEGAWAATPHVPEPGQWEARLTLTRPDGARLQVSRRLMLP
jgi:nitrogen fixation protein FixH